MKTRRFGTASRIQQQSTIATPGPGTYRPPSDFGYLEFRNKNQTPMAGRSRRNQREIRSMRHASLDYEATVAKEDVMGDNKI